MVCTVSKICSTSTGARPMEGSSRRSSRGLAMRARPMASICCSPPESVPATCERRSWSRVKMPKTRSMSVRTSPSERVKAPISRFSNTLSRLKMRRPSGTWVTPRRTMACEAMPTSELPSKTTSPSRGARSPEMARSVVVLPAPLLPSRATTSPSPTRKVTPFKARISPSDTWRFRTSSTLGLRARCPLAAAEIGFDDAGVLLDVGGAPLGNLLPVVEHGDVVGDLHDHAHVVLDEEDGEAEVAHQLAQESHETARFSLGHARGGLVEEEERGLRSESAADLEPALIAVGQVARDLVGTVAQADHVEELRGTRPEPPLLALPVRVAAHRAPEARVHPGVHAHQHVLHRRHVPEEPDVLERPAHAEGGDLVGAQPGEGVAAEPDRALLGNVETGEDVEEGRLARAVGPDDGGDPSLRELEVHAVQGDQPAEPLGYAGRLEEGGHPRARRARACGGGRGGCPAAGRSS